MFQIRPYLVGDVTFTSGDRYEYLITDEQLEQARRKMHDGAGSIEWQPDFGSRNDEPEILNVRAIARVKPVRRKDYSDVLVQLWANPVTGRLYLVDPDDGEHAWCVEPVTPPTPHLDQPEPRDFGMEAYCLVEEDVKLADLGTPVGKPPADEVVWDLVAEYRGGHRGVTLVAAGEHLNDQARAYLSRILQSLANA